MQSADPDSIEDIVRRARLGDADAFSALYTSYFTPLYRYVYFRVADKTEVDDLVQEVFLKAYTAFDRYTYSGGSPLAYFYTVARHSIIDHYRKRRLPTVDGEVLETIADESATAEEVAIQREEIETVRAHLRQLPQDQQDVIVLRFIEGLSTPEIATMLGKTEVSVRQMQSRGLRALRTLMRTTTP